MVQKRTLLLVENNQQIRQALNKFQATNDCEILCVDDCLDVYEVISSLKGASQIGVIVFAGKALDGKHQQLINKLKKHCPSAAKLIFLEKNEVDALLGITADGLAYHILTKPWSENKLTPLLKKAFTEYELANENLRMAKALEESKEKFQALNTELEVKVKDKVEQLVQAINYDALTGLPSRNLIHDQLEHVVKYAKRAKQTIVILYIGLDNFKLINESMGYNSGDQLLKMVTERLSMSMDSNDALARMGGDEFCLVINNTSSNEDPGEIASRFLERIIVPFELNRREIFLTASIGISVYPEDSGSAPILFSNAESAMRQVKIESKNGFQYYSGKLNQFARKRLSLESQLRKALNRNEFELYFQPRVNIESGLIVGVEALLRWHHPKKGLLQPVDFLPVLEDTGLIEPVGEWVIEESCRTLVRWSEIDLPSVNIGVNLSAKQFRNTNLLSVVEDILKRTNMPRLGSGLEFEITESLLMENIGTTKKMLSGFSEMGIKLAIDDFGTGYSSLSYLIQFPLNYLKIDKSFVTDIADSDDAKAIVEAIISLSYSLKLGVIAEGVETTQQLNTLQALACKEFQGFLFSEPLAEEEVVRMLKADKRLSIATLSPSEYASHLHRYSTKH